MDVHISTVSPVNRHLAVLLSNRSAVPDRLQAVLKYRAGRGGEELRDIEEAVWLDTKPCGFKGQRLQFICFGCGRRVAELYPDGVHFRCKHRSRYERWCQGHDQRGPSVSVAEQAGWGREHHWHRDDHGAHREPGARGADQPEYADARRGTPRKAPRQSLVHDGHARWFSSDVAPPVEIVVHPVAPLM